MFFSKELKSSPHCASSPNGHLIATLISHIIRIRCVKSLQVVNTITLPRGFPEQIVAFLWSPSSDRILVASPERVYITSALEGSFKADIKNPVHVASKNFFIQFGPSGTDILICSPFGLKFAVFDLVASRCFEMDNPKFSTPLSAHRTFSVRPRSNHLALLTRIDGKDLVSLHHPVTRELLRSWHPDTTDANQLMWTSDGRWLVLCESPAQGHKVLFYTSDGHLFKTWAGPVEPPSADKDFALGAGISVIECSKDGSLVAVGNHTRCSYVLDMMSVTESMRLHHPHVVIPSQTMQIWQEQVTESQTGRPVHAFVRASQAVSPPSAVQDHQQPSKMANKTATNTHHAPGSAAELSSGVGLLAMDASTTLVASKIDEAPSTIWVWDLKAAELRAVIMFHGHVSGVSWHPSIREILAIKCEGDAYDQVIFAWDPLWEGPRTVDFTAHIESKAAARKSRWSWLDLKAESAALFYSDPKVALLASLADSDDEKPPWESDRKSGHMPPSGSPRRREESPLDLMPADGGGCDAGSDNDMDTGELDDTFSFKKFV